MITCTIEDGGQTSLRHVTVSCLVIRDNQILLSKRSQRLLLEKGKWSLLGGFADRNETTIGTGIREIFEESGWEATNLRLLRINDNPRRPHEDRQNVDFIYIADAVKKAGEKDWETEEARWFSLDELPPADKIAFDHAESIELYKKYVEEHFPIPVIGSPSK